MNDISWQVCVCVCMCVLMHDDTHHFQDLCMSFSFSLLNPLINFLRLQTFRVIDLLISSNANSLQHMLSSYQRAIIFAQIFKTQSMQII